MTLDEIRGACEAAVRELMDTAGLAAGDILVVGCSTSEVLGEKIGTCSSRETAQAILDGLYPPLKEKEIYLAAQCCEHLNRALILEEEALRRYGLEQVNVIPQPKAGGSFATACWEAFEHPAAVESLNCAKAGMDIGDTLIGMHLKRVAVPVRLSVKNIGEAHLVCARTRPKFVGGERAIYNKTMM